VPTASIQPEQNWGAVALCQLMELPQVQDESKPTYYASYVNFVLPLHLTVTLTCFLTADELV
jgi:hypothetical protein